MPTASSDAWVSGHAYEPYVGRWSRLVAAEFLGWLAAARDARWIDVGCGTGALTAVTLGAAAPKHVHAIDPSFGYLSFARHHVRDRRATFVVADARSLPLASERVDVSLLSSVPPFGIA